MTSPTTPPPPKSVLVVGGCGFLGHHIIQSLLREYRDASAIPKITVIDVNISQNRFDNVEYHTYDITSLSEVREAISTIKPQVIIHTASALPSVIPTHEPDDVEMFKKVNIGGTINLLECAREESSVEVFVYTSSTGIMKRKESYLVTEDAKSSDVQMRISRFDPYSGTKGIADTKVLLANSRMPSSKGGLRTCCLRVGGMYGVGDVNVVWPAIEALRFGQIHHQIGSNSKRCDFLAVENAAHAHVLAMKGLLAGITNLDAAVIDGEAFFITDGNPMSYWAFRRKLWAHAGYIQDEKDVKVVSAAVIVVFAFILEWMYLIFSLGRKQPQDFRTRKLGWVCMNRTFDLKKAKERLGYVPKVSTDEAMMTAVKWAVDRQAEMGLQGENRS